MSTRVALPFTLPRSGYRGTEFYRLVQSPYKRDEVLLEDTGGIRGRDLALAVGGVTPWKKPGIRLSPARCIKWLALFQSGFDAVKVEHNGWRFRVSGGPLVVLAEAVRTSEVIGREP